MMPEMFFGPKNITEMNLNSAPDVKVMAWDWGASAPDASVAVLIEVAETQQFVRDFADLHRRLTT